MRALILALALANLLFAAWAAGWLDAVTGWPASGDRDPHRIERQLRPDKVRIVRPGSVATRPSSTGADLPLPAGTDAPTTPSAAPAALGLNTAPSAAGAPAASPASAPSDSGCFEAGPFTPAEVVAAEAALVRAALPAGSWSDRRVDRPGEWILYAGRYASREGLQVKIDELKRLRVSFEEVRSAPDLELGLALGRFNDRAEADAALAQLAQQGVRNVRVLATVAPTTTHVLRVERADAALQAQLASIRAGALGAGFVRCGLTAAAAPGR